MYRKRDSEIFQFSSVAQSCPTLRPHESQHTRPPCPSTTPGVHSDSRPSSQWRHPPISSSVMPFFCPQSLPASESFAMSQFFPWGGQSTGVSALASFLPNTQDWLPLEWTGWISNHLSLPKWKAATWNSNPNSFNFKTFSHVHIQSNQERQPIWYFMICVEL